jgi:hypothetical protein
VPDAKRRSRVGRNVTFWRADYGPSSGNRDDKALPKQRAKAERRNHGEPIGWALTDKDGNAYWLLDSYGNGTGLEEGGYYFSEVYASFSDAEGNDVEARGVSTIRYNVRQGPKPSLVPATLSAKPGDSVKLVLNAMTWDGQPAEGARVTFYVKTDAPGSVQLRTGALRNSGNHAERELLPGEQTKTVVADKNGTATYTVSSSVAGDVWVTADYEVRVYDEVTGQSFYFEVVEMEVYRISFVSPGVSSISLTPISQTVRPGRYAQLSAALTPPLSGVNVEFTVAPFTSMGAELQVNAGEE